MLNDSKLARLDLNLLLPFALLHEERHAGRVARRLNLSPSAVSHALRRLRLMFDDPLFLPTARGMTPTSRADEFAPIIRDIIGRVGGMAASMLPFDPATSARSFRIGAADAAAAPMLPDLVECVHCAAPGIGLSLIPLLPAGGHTAMEPAWAHVIEALDSGELDLAVLPFRPASPRIRSVRLYEEQFVAVFRFGHEFGRAPSLTAFAEARHVLVSATGDKSGIVDVALAERGMTRRVALTVPSFFIALDVIGRTDLIGAIPQRFANQQSGRFGLATAALPFPMPMSTMHAVVLEAATADRGIAWLIDRLCAALSASD